jgi:hypothetical protein
MDKYAHLEDTRQPVEHDEDAEEPTMATGLRGNPNEEDCEEQFWIVIRRIVPLNVDVAEEE